MPSSSACEARYTKGTLNPMLVQKFETVKITNIGSVNRCRLSISQITPASPGQQFCASSCNRKTITWRTSKYYSRNVHHFRSHVVKIRTCSWRCSNHHATGNEVYYAVNPDTEYRAGRMFDSSIFSLHDGRAHRAHARTAGSMLSACFAVLLDSELVRLYNHALPYHDRSSAIDSLHPFLLGPFYHSQPQC